MPRPEEQVNTLLIDRAWEAAHFANTMRDAYLEDQKLLDAWALLQIVPGVEFKEQSLDAIEDIIRKSKLNFDAAVELTPSFRQEEHTSEINIFNTHIAFASPEKKEEDDRSAEADELTTKEKILGTFHTAFEQYQEVAEILNMRASHPSSILFTKPESQVRREFEAWLTAERLDWVDTYLMEDIEQAFDLVILPNMTFSPEQEIRLAEEFQKNIWIDGSPFLVDSPENIDFQHKENDNGSDVTILLMPRRYNLPENTTENQLDFLNRHNSVYDTNKRTPTAIEAMTHLMIMCRNGDIDLASEDTWDDTYYRQIEKYETDQDGKPVVECVQVVFVSEKGILTRETTHFSNSVMPGRVAIV